ncbi:hypothetical protein [Streptomyces sp. NPDC048527]|uniref:hypothetical protein n=1 Tax=Streptomyces sp. NPDC048527 TaxID=3365568 RepID=UPI0037106E2E
MPSPPPGGAAARVRAGQQARSHGRYALIGQPETLVILERMETHPFGLRGPPGARSKRYREGLHMPLVGKVPPQICTSSSAGTLTDLVGTKLPKLPHP